MSKTKKIFCNTGGFTLIELIVVMAVFITVLIISASAFNTILLNTGRVFKSEESNIEGVVGLEMLRHDLQQAGYGLYTEQSAKSYSEAVDALPATNNDSTGGTFNVPRPLVFINDLDGTIGAVDGFTPLLGSDYISIKGTTVSRSPSAKLWTFLNITSVHSAPPVVKTWATTADQLTAGTDRVVVLQKQFGNPPLSRLVQPDPTRFSYTYSDTAFLNLTSATNGTYMVYGVDNKDLRFPFNRSDYFVATPAVATDRPSACAPGTGILYKATLNHTNGKLTEKIPVLDCVLDMQVVLGWDSDGDGLVDTWTSADGKQQLGGVAMDPALGTSNNNQMLAVPPVPNIRTNLKIIKVYLVVQDGRMDSSFTSKSPLTFYANESKYGDVPVTSLTRAGTGQIPLAANQQHYRWKLYRIVVRPKNLLSNQ